MNTKHNSFYKYAPDTTLKFTRANDLSLPVVPVLWDDDGDAVLDFDRYAIKSGDDFALLL